MSTDSSVPTRRQGIYWLATIPHHGFTPWLPDGFCFIRGQLELGAARDYLHWQILVIARRKCSARYMQECFGPWHFELTRSKAADDYVWKEDTRVDGTQFELGQRPHSRSAPRDWDKVWDDAVSGQFMSIPADIRVRCYSTIKRIHENHLRPVGIERTCYVFWGPTHTGKSHRAALEAGEDYYPKDPNSKFWCSYRGEEHVVINEFRGRIDISHMLQWTDRYKTLIDTKHGRTALKATTIWITSNLHPSDWWPDCDAHTVAAFIRRCRIEHLTETYEFPRSPS